MVQAVGDQWWTYKGDVDDDDGDDVRNARIIMVIRMMVGNVDYG